MINIAILGEKQAGKSTVFNAIVGTTKSEHRERKGVLVIPDKNLDFLHIHYPDAKKTNIHIEFIDTEKIDFNNLNIRNSDIFIYVLPFFEGRSIIDLKSFIEDMIINDISIIENRLKKIEKSHERLSENEPEFLKKLKAHLDNGKRIIDFGEFPNYLRGYSFLSIKPLICIGNISEEDTEREEEYEGINVIYSKCELQKELLEVEKGEKEEFKKMYGIKEPLKEKIIEYTKLLLNLIIFYTANKNEVKAYFLKKGESILRAAGIIHSDMEKGFIRASVINIEDLKRFGDEKRAKEGGCYKTEGKEYIVKDGDIIYIRFSN